MAVETKPLPAIAETAFQFCARPTDVALARLERETLDSMGLSADDGWVVDFGLKIVRRTVPDQ